MKILLLGGTQFIGRHIVEVLLQAGHDLTIFNRGQSLDELPPAVERLRGDRDLGAEGLKSLKGRRWDVCIDVSGYTARQVRPSAELVRHNIRRYLFVSAVSVYGDPALRPVRETHPRVSPAAEDVLAVEGEMYGRLKVTCENIVQEIYGERATALRAQIVVGPHDPSGRYSYWLERARQQAPMLAPGDGSDHLQLIDVRDLARFVLTVIENNLGGAFNLAGPRFTWKEFINLSGAPNPVWVPAKILQANGVSEFELPLYRFENGPRSALMDVSNDLARASGLTLTNPEETMRRIRDSLRRVENRNVSGFLSRDREAELIKIARSTTG
jgi:2'-hydroxyisoflavone reductase